MLVVGDEAPERCSPRGPKLQLLLASCCERMLGTARQQTEGPATRPITAGRDSQVPERRQPSARTRDRCPSNYFICHAPSLQPAPQALKSCREGTHTSLQPYRQGDGSPACDYQARFLPQLRVSTAPSDPVLVAGCLSGNLAATSPSLPLTPRLPPFREAPVADSQITPAPAPRRPWRASRSVTPTDIDITLPCALTHMYSYMPRWTYAIRPRTDSESM